MYFIYIGIGVAIASIGFFLFRNDKDALTIRAKAIVVEKQAAANNIGKKLLFFKVNDHVIISTDNSDLYIVLQQGDSVTIQYKELLNSEQEVTDLKFITAQKIVH